MSAWQKASPFLGVLFLGACGPAEEDFPVISGSIEITDQDLVGQVETLSSFAYSDGERVVAYLSSAEGASCQDAAAYLRGDADFDPSPLFRGGYCNVYLGAPFAGEPVTYDDSTYDVTWVLNCTLGDGEFVWEERDQGDWDYYWSGRYWQGWPTSYTVTLSGGDGEAVTVEAEMSSYDGGFIYEEMHSYPAEGVVSGTVQAQWCPDLRDALLR